MIAVVLVFVYWYGGDAPSLRGWVPKVENTSATAEIKASDVNTSASPTDEGITEETETPSSADNLPLNSFEKENSEEMKLPKEDKVNENVMVIDENTGKDKFLTEPVPEGKPIPVEPQDVVISEEKLTCTLSVRCDTIIENIEWLDKEKIKLVPKDGIIFAEKTVTFYEGESVFNLLLREMKQNKIHMEFENVPIYNSAYIEGIANLYEFDCGELSGWMYKVNGWFPNYGCSRYQLKAGDKVEWVYTCNLGSDVGGNYAAG